jgi:hypothetical protein
VVTVPVVMVVVGPRHLRLAVARGRRRWCWWRWCWWGAASPPARVCAREEEVVVVAWCRWWWYGAGGVPRHLRLAFARGRWWWWWWGRVTSDSRLREGGGGGGGGDEGGGGAGGVPRHLRLAFARGRWWWWWYAGGVPPVSRLQRGRWWGFNISVYLNCNTYCDSPLLPAVTAFSSSWCFECGG